MGAQRSLGAGVVAVLVAAVLAGCTGPVTYGKNVVPPDEYGVTHHGPQPTARTHDGAVEVWDLTGTPSAAEYGIADDDDDFPFVGIYSAHPARSVRLLLADGKQVSLRAGEVVFECWDTGTASVDPETGEVIVPAGRQFRAQVSGWVTEDPDEAIRRHRSVVAQLGLDDDSVTELQKSITRTVDPLDSASAGGSDEYTGTDGTAVSVSTRFRTAVGVEYRVFHTEVHVSWPVQPLPSP